jgi:membrane protease YdiL (CAAX protease family)
MRRMSVLTGSKGNATGWNSRQLALYFVLAYGVSLVLWLPMLLGRSHSLFSFSIGTYGPTLAAVATHWMFCRNWRAVQIWTTLPKFLIGVTGGVLAVLAAAFLAALLMTKSGFDRWQWRALVQIVTFFGPNLLGGPLGEEAGWRGFALPRLQSRFSPLTSSLILGFLWANWHVPLMLAHVYNVTWWQFVLVTMAASVFLSYGFNRSAGSTLCAVVVHGFYNIGTGIILNDLIGKATLRSNPVQHNVFWMAYVAVAILLCIFTKGRLGFCTKTGEVGEFKSTQLG